MADVRMMSGSATSASKYLLHQLDSRGWSLDTLSIRLHLLKDYVLRVVANEWHKELSLAELVAVAEDLARALEVAPEPLMAMFLADRGAKMSEPMANVGATTILDEAAKVVTGQRREDYGGVRESFSRIAGMWSAYLGVEVGPQDVSMMMILLKVARARAGIEATSEPQRDSLVDIAGYAACSEMLIETEG